MSTIKTETLSTPSNATVPVDTVVNGTAKAWVNFNGTGTVAIRRAFNVSSITDNGTGDYTVTLAVAMPDADYAWSGGAGTDNINGTIWVSGPANVSRSTWKQAGTLRVVSTYQNTLRNDVSDFNVTIFS